MMIPGTPGSISMSHSGEFARANFTAVFCTLVILYQVSDLTIQIQTAGWMKLRLLH